MAPTTRDDGVSLAASTAALPRIEPVDLRGLFFRLAGEGQRPVTPSDDVIALASRAGGVLHPGLGIDLRAAADTFDTAVTFRAPGSDANDVPYVDGTLGHGDGRETFGPDATDRQLHGASLAGTETGVGPHDNGIKSGGQAPLVPAAPDAQDDAFITGEDGMATFSVLGNDDPGRAGSVIVSLDGVTLLSGDVPGVQPADISLDAGGNLTFTAGAAYDALGPGASVVFGFTYTISNASGRYDTAYGTLTVCGVNDAPVVGTNTGTEVAEGGNIAITGAMLQEEDPDDAGAGLLYTLTDLPDHGVLLRGGAELGLGGGFTQTDLDAGLVTYIHDGSETTADQFAFELSDGGEDGAASASGTFAIAVAPVNDAPVGVADRAETTEDALVVVPILANDSDPEGGPLTVVLPPGATSLHGASLSLNAAGEVVYDPREAAPLRALGPGECVVDSFSYTVRDSEGAESTVSVEVLVEGVSEAGFFGGTLAYAYLLDSFAIFETEFQVGDGVELRGLYSLEGGVASVDIANSTITIGFDSFSSFNGGAFNGFRITDEAGMVPEIAGVEIASSNMMFFGEWNVAVSADSIAVDFQGLSSAPDTLIVLNVTFAPDAVIA